MAKNPGNPGKSLTRSPGHAGKKHRAGAQHLRLTRAQAAHSRLLDMLFASTTQPIGHRATTQLIHMRSGLDALRTGQACQPEHWRAVADAVNLCESLIELGHMADDGDCIAAASQAMAQAATSHKQQGQPLALTGQAFETVAQVLEAYEQAVQALPERALVEAYNRTSAKVQAAQRTQNLPKGTVVVQI
jgi:hypothetical protein